VFHARSVTFLGYVLSNTGISMDPSKTQAIQDFPVPQSLTQLRSFLGLANFYRGFIPRFSEKVKKLTDLTKKGKFQWSPEATKAMGMLKTAIMKDVVLL